MSVHSQITREIDEGPAGPRIAAFFDVDRTLIAGFSALQFFRDGLGNGLVSPADFAAALGTAVRFQLGQVGFSGFVTGTAGMLRGRSEAAFAEIGERIFRDRLATEIYPESRALVQAHRRKGHTLALVSAATRYQIDPLARELEIPHVLCTQLEVAGRSLHRRSGAADVLRAREGAGRAHPGAQAAAQLAEELLLHRQR